MKAIQSIAACVCALAMFAGCAEGLCYWSPEGQQCDDNRAGAPGIFWGYNAADGEGKTNKWTHPPAGGGPPRGFSCQDGQSSDELPFGLQTCSCEGEAIGRIAGGHGCRQVQESCGLGTALRPFAASGQANNLLGAIQAVCDELAWIKCKSSALEQAGRDYQCRALLQFGNYMCSAKEAEEIFEEEVASYCVLPQEPLDSSAAENQDFPGGIAEEEPVGRESYSSIKEPEEASGRAEKSEGDEEPSREEEDPEEPSDDCVPSSPGGCSCNAVESAAGAGEAACQHLLTECADNAWGDSENSLRPCSPGLSRKCIDAALSWAQANNGYCKQVYSAGSKKCSVQEARRQWDKKVQDECKSQ